MSGRSLPTSAVLAMFFIFCAIAVIPTSAIQTATDSKIAALYKDKLVALSNPYCGQELKFDAAANLISSPTWGDWKTCQGMHIKSVQVEDDKIKIAAQRVPITYDCASRQVRDASDDVAKTEKKPTSAHDQDVSIEVQLGPNSNDTTALELMDKLFRPADLGIGPMGEIRHVGIGMSPPVPTRQPDADLPAGLKPGYQGTVVLAGIVGTDGQVHNPHVVRSLSKSADENALKAVSKWRFKPATMCGIPVAIQLKIEMTFHLMQ